jgi:hypothetical protein
MGRRSFEIRIQPISKSRYIDEEAAPRTAGSDRAIKLIGSVGEILKRMKPLHTTENYCVFLNQEGNPLNFHTWRAGVWYRSLEAWRSDRESPIAAPSVYQRGFNGINIKWLGEYSALPLP